MLNLPSTKKYLLGMPAISITPRAPVPMAQYQWVDRVNGLRRTLVISRADRPLFPGTIGDAFRRLQGSSHSAEVLARRIWLFHRSRSHLDIWKNAVAAAREARRKVVLPQPLLLLQELADLPLNEW